MIPFTANPLDRASEKRADAAWIEARRRDPQSLILPLWRLEPFLLGAETSAPPAELGLLRPGLCESMAAEDAPCIFLGLESGRAYFALDISAAEAPAEKGPLAGLGHFRDARAAAQMLPLGDAAIMGQAKAMIDWHQRHGFCARCGHATQSMDAGYRRLCPSCKAEHFPRTDPVVIMLATLGEECLVGRGRQFPRGMYSALAGFVEPSETIEEAVRRELKEEAGIETGAVTYYTTQPWPFPSSLMIGCFAQALTKELQVDESELAEARWLDRATARAIISGERVEGLWLPPPVAIAHHLIKSWATG
ncbi:MAG: NAD(+) diphosphatase [Alphaproteobacteria bacterium]|nr:NAD(+) diphosphatase [Alphaproteobacteria bacterium]MBV9692940.1 NAD(+) diphosphatase [Alphaproteobacteria bacterium]